MPKYIQELQVWYAVSDIYQERILLFKMLLNNHLLLQAA